MNLPTFVHFRRHSDHLGKEKELATFCSLPSPNTLALCGRFNASVACMTKQLGCSSEGKEETYVLVDHHLLSTAQFKQPM